MDIKEVTLQYSDTGFFSKLVADYIAGNEKLQPFYQHSVNLQGIQSAIEQRKLFNTNRPLLVSILQEKYKGTATSKKQQINIDLLLKENCFTITTAHQPNIFTGHLYFIYKILHAIKLADHLSNALPDSNFVPIYYMGSEDADLDELGHIFINGQKYEWKTNQTGAVGRMKVDKALVQLIEMFGGQLTINPFGEKIVDLMKRCYHIGNSIEQATFTLVNELFADYGLLVLLPDDANLKHAFLPVITRELAEQFSHVAVAATVAQFPQDYKVQTSGRELNLFYLQEQSRERIEKHATGYSVVNTDLHFTEEDMLSELKEHPEKFSPNVILRPVFQETILPNIAFIGGGGEIGYWLELKKVFDATGVPYPMLIVRNSFVIIEKKLQTIIDKLQFTPTEIFEKEFDLMNKLVKRDAVLQVELLQERAQLSALYNQIQTVAEKIDPTLATHTKGLLVKADKKLADLEKKLLRAEKIKYAAQQNQLHTVKNKLFPNNGLQERVENFMGLYAKWGDDFIKTLYDNSLTLEQQFTVLVEK